jgi:hypothetical protein
MKNTRIQPAMRGDQEKDAMSQSDWKMLVERRF